jgi:Domain of unknown function (DUF4149)
MAQRRGATIDIDGHRFKLGSPVRPALSLWREEVTALAEGLHWIAVTLWVGGIWIVGYLVAPVLFYSVGDRALAGSLAGHMFSALAWLGYVCAAYLLMFRLAVFRTGALAQGFFWLTLLMLLLVAAGHLGVQPVLAGLKQQAAVHDVVETVVKNRFAVWHGVASVLHLVLSALGVLLVLLQPKALRW